jgi:hypothetical protein
LPDWAQKCQFCGAAVTPVAIARRDAPPKKSNYMFGIAKWVWVTYYTIAGWFVAHGLFNLSVYAIAAARFNATATPDSPNSIFMPVHAVNAMFFLLIALALAAVVVGAGLLLQNDFIKGIANWYCALMALNGIYGVFWAIAMPIGAGRVVAVALSSLDIVCGLMMIYCILETNEQSAF